MVANIAKILVPLLTMLLLSFSCGIYRGTNSKTKVIKEEAAKASLDVAHAVCIGLRAQFRAFFYALSS